MEAQDTERPSMEHASAFTPSVLEQWRKRENLLPGLALLVLTVLGWVYITYQASTMGAMEAMSGARISTMGGFAPFILGWTAMIKMGSGRLYSERTLAQRTAFASG